MDREVFNKNVQYKVGVRDRVKLWKDRVWRSSSQFGISSPVQFCYKQRGFRRVIFDMSRGRDRRI